MNRPFIWMTLNDKTVGDHHHIRPGDRCYYLGDYIVGDGFENATITAINQEIRNLKIVSKNPTRNYFKRMSVIQLGAWLEDLGSSFIESHTWLPVPPSRVHGDPKHNPKMLDILKGLNVRRPVDLRELVIQTISTRKSSMSGGNRVRHDELVGIYRIAEEFAEPAPDRIVVLDDVLTTGAHYRAMHTVLSRRFPDAEIVGVFFARSVHLDR